MNTAELKIDLINKITKLKEVHLIEEIQNLIDFELEKGVFKLSSAQKKRITEAKIDSVLSEGKANSDIEKWLKEK